GADEARPTAWLMRVAVGRNRTERTAATCPEGTNGDRGRLATARFDHSIWIRPFDTERGGDFGLRGRGGPPGRRLMLGRWSPRAHSRSTITRKAETLSAASASLMPATAA